MTELLRGFADPMSVDDFVSAMKTPVPNEPKEAELISALRAFDVKDCGELSRFDVTQLFCHIGGEKLSMPAVAALLDAGPFWSGTNNDKADIAGLRNWLVRPASSMPVTNKELQSFRVP